MNIEIHPSIYFVDPPNPNLGVTGNIMHYGDVDLFLLLLRRYMMSLILTSSWMF